VTSLAELLGRPIGGVARVVVRHSRRREFRWLGVLELALIALASLCVLPLLLVLAFLRDDAGAGVDDGPGFLERTRSRLWRCHHDVTVSFFGPGGALLAESTHTPTSATEGDALVGSILAMAAREGVVVLETLGPGPVGELVDVFYGGRPLLARPDAIDLEATAARLAAQGIETRWHEEHVALVVLGRPQRRGMAVLGLILLAPLIPVLLTLSRARELLHDLLWSARGELGASTRLELRPTALRIERSRAGRVRHQDVIDLGELVAIRYGAGLGYDRDVRRHDPRLSLHTAKRARVLESHGAGEALRTFLVGALVQLHARRPGASLWTADATRCPYCATLYRLELGARCPSCGAFATALA
jgi:hypothetical protein